MSLRHLIPTIILLFSACTHGQGATLPRCPRVLPTITGARILHGTGSTLTQAREKALSPQDTRLKALTALWAKEDLLYPPENALNKRAKSRKGLFIEYLDHLNQLSHQCEPVKQCTMGKGAAVHAWLHCKPLQRLEDQLQRLVTRLASRLPPWAKVAVYPLTLSPTPSMGSLLFSQLVEDALFTSERMRGLKLIRYNYPGQLIWDLTAHSNVDQGVTWARDAHYLLRFAITAASVQWLLVSLKQRFPRILERGTLTLPAPMATFLKTRGLPVETTPAAPCSTALCHGERALVAYIRDPQGKGPKQLLTACKKGFHDTCVLSVTLTAHKHKGDIKALDAAMALVSPGCKAGHQRSCTARGILHLSRATAILANFLVSGKGDGKKMGIASMGERLKAVEQFESSCIKGEPHACIKKARLLNSGNVMETLAQKSRLYYRACDAGAPRGCAEAGCFPCYLSLMNAKSLNPYGKPQYDRYKAMVAKSCRNGRPGGCLTLGQQDNLPAKQRLTAFEQACAWGYTSVCFGAGSGNLNGNIVKTPDRFRALRFFTLGCDDDHGASCIALA
ncbi:hypothetical protein KJ865_01095, partial [Myxococcota bacterium]|nr:hypothetical protein [Myxococcota bacterium]